MRPEWETDGYVVVAGVVDAGLVGEARSHVDWLLARNPSLRPEQLGHELMTDDPFWVRLVSDPRLVDVAAEFVGPDVAVYASHYVAKPPGTGQPVLWHQDAGYWGLDPMEVVTVWLALDDSGPDNGCMRVIPGSHRGSVLPLQENVAVANVLSSEIAVEVDEALAVDVVVPAGGVSVHHPGLVHGSRANTSGRWRRGLTIRYIPTSTRILGEGVFPSAFLVRGGADAGVGAGGAGAGGAGAGAAGAGAGGNQYNPWPRWVAGRHMPFAGCEEWA